MKNPQADPLKTYSRYDGLIFLLRHGQTRGSVEKRYIGKTDVRLDQTGLEQAGYWRQAFASIDLTAVYVSSLSRCRKTAEIIADGRPITIDAALDEIDLGTWDGKTFDHIRENMPDQYERRGCAMDTFRPEGGESFHDLSCRTLPFFQRLSASTSGNILAVTHAGVIRTVLCHIKKMALKDLFNIKVSYGDLFVIAYK